MRLKGILIFLSLIISFLFVPAEMAQMPAAEGIMLNGTNMIKAPEMSIRGPAANWTYPYSYYPVYTVGQTISGTYFGPERESGSRVEAFVSTFNFSDFLNGSFAPEKEGPSRSSITLDSTGDAKFNITGIRSGLYNLFVVDENLSTVLSHCPLLVTPQNVSIDSLPEVRAGDTLNVIVSTSGTGNQTRYYGAVMVSRKDYEGIRLNITSSGGHNLTSAIEWGNRTMQIQGLPSLSSDFVLKLLSMLPENSAVGMQDSTKPEAGFHLITDPEWARGDYILICVAYSSESGMLGMGQKEVEVV
jgi:methanogen extracellular protein (TIGR04279 family)